MLITNFEMESKKKNERLRPIGFRGSASKFPEGSPTYSEIARSSFLECFCSLQLMTVGLVAEMLNAEIDIEAVYFCSTA